MIECRGYCCKNLMKGRSKHSQESRASSCQLIFYERRIRLTISFPSSLYVKLQLMFLLMQLSVKSSPVIQTYGRLTASNFGAIVKAVKRNRFADSLFSSLIGEQNLDGVRSIQYGRDKEKRP